MGNRAVISIKRETPEEQAKQTSIYLHWNGGRDSVEGFLAYCNLRGFRTPESDNYGWARLTQVISNFFGGGTSIGIDNYSKLDTDNYDNGVYFIKDWEIVGRDYFSGSEQRSYDLDEMLIEIDKKQPTDQQLGAEGIAKAWKEKLEQYKKEKEKNE